MNVHVCVCQSGQRDATGALHRGRGSLHYHCEVREHSVQDLSSMSTVATFHTNAKPKIMDKYKSILYVFEFVKGLTHDRAQGTQVITISIPTEPPSCLLPVITRAWVVLDRIFSQTLNLPRSFSS